MSKVFKLKAHEIAPIAQGHGGCIASDRITVDGMPVGYMYRDAPIRPEDSGWAFLAGDEDQAYLDDPEFAGIYDVNTIANYNPAIIPFLNLPVGARLLRGEDGLFYSEEEPEYQRVDPRTADYLERLAAEGAPSLRAVTTRGMWLIGIVIGLFSVAILCLALANRS